MRRAIAIFVIVAAFGLSFYGQRALNPPTQTDTPPSSEAGYSRIISLAPSITETLYALDLGDRVIGVTNFCDFPPDVRSKPSVGGIIDTNYEAIMHLQPDVVVLYPVHRDAQIRIKELGINTLTVDCRTLDGILESIQIIGTACHVIDRSEALLADMHADMQAIRSKTEELLRPTVLISAGRGKDGGTLGEVYAAGKGQWYDDIIEMAGGKNVFTDDTIPFPAVTGEGLVRLNPEVIVEMAPKDAHPNITAEAIISQWDVFPDINAVQTERIYVLDGDYTTIPGPRIVRIVEDLARVLHPGADWGPHE
ncbi:MAG: helical backbone metal receptor [Candidatus Hydrogenedentota bacterium]